MLLLVSSCLHIALLGGPVLLVGPSNSPHCHFMYNPPSLHRCRVAYTSSPPGVGVCAPTLGRQLHDRSVAFMCESFGPVVSDPSFFAAEAVASLADFTTLQLYNFAALKTRWKTKKTLGKAVKTHGEGSEITRKGR